MTFKDALREKLKGILSEEESLLLPAGFQTVGRIIVLKLNPKLNDKKLIVGQACLDLLSSVKSVYLNTGKIEGTFRTPQQVELIVGENNPIAEHKENGVIYRFDVTKIMFSKGNINERKFLTTVVKQNEIIVDMFAGIGYFLWSASIFSPSKTPKITFSFSEKSEDIFSTSTSKSCFLTPIS